VLVLVLVRVRVRVRVVVRVVVVVVRVLVSTIPTLHSPYWMQLDPTSTRIKLNLQAKANSLCSDVC
jgi:hypothetical protein